jgi:hypothetical protein
VRSPLAAARVQSTSHFSFVDEFAAFPISVRAAVRCGRCMAGLLPWVSGHGSNSTTWQPFRGRRGNEKA